MGGLEDYFEVPSSGSVQLESRKHSRLVSRKGFYGTFPSCFQEALCRVSL